MGQAKNELIERLEQERICGECGSAVKVNQEKNSYHCETCEETYTNVTQCVECENMIKSDSELIICSECERRHLEG